MMSYIRNFFVEFIAVFILVTGAFIGFCVWLLLDSWRNHGTDT
jgi:Trk-type K+ transport system membrane component